MFKMIRMLKVVFLFAFSLSFADINEEKIVICGVGRDVEKGVMNIIHSTELLASHFKDYAVIIYENNSKDLTKELYQKWTQINSKVHFISEDLPPYFLRFSRYQRLAYARNQVLDKLMTPEFDDARYVIMVDLDFEEPWDVEAIIDSIKHPEQEWDAIFANGGWDQLAFRSREFPIGYELLGPSYFDTLEEARPLMNLDPKERYFLHKEWIPVYSAFGGLGIYKKESIKGCRYSGLTNQELTKALIRWLTQAKQDHPFNYHLIEKRIQKAEPIRFFREIFVASEEEKEDLVRLKENRLRVTCEHICFHAMMANRGHDKLFINPRLKLSGY